VSLAAFSPRGGESVGSSPTGLLLFAYQSVPPAPGRDTSISQPPPSAPAGGPASPASGGGLSSSLPLLIMIVPMILLLFFSSRSQQNQAKKQAATVASLKKGDRVLTDAGISGRLVEMGDRYAKIEIAPGVKIDVLKARVAGADTPETQTQTATPAASDKK
jgi:preprotein translocase subunit YajC